MVSQPVIDEFLQQRRLAFVGASGDPKEFSASVYRAMKGAGYELFPVNPNATTVDGDPCVATAADLPDGIDGAVVMVPAAVSASVVQACIDRGVPRIWLHQGVGPSSVSAEAVARCRDAGIPVIDGACPMMFLDGASLIHRVHRWGRVKTGHLTA